MLTLLFIVLMFTVFGKILGIALKAAWGLAKIVSVLVVFPIVLIGFVVSGFVTLAIGILIITGLLTLVKVAFS